MSGYKYLVLDIIYYKYTAWVLGFVLFVQNFIVLKLIYTKMFNFIYLFVLNGIFFVIVL